MTVHLYPGMILSVVWMECSDVVLKDDFVEAGCSAGSFPLFIYFLVRDDRVNLRRVHLSLLIL
jgi:hypothetical protein